MERNVDEHVYMRGANVEKSTLICSFPSLPPSLPPCDVPRSAVHGAGGQLQGGRGVDLHRLGITALHL